MVLTSSFFSALLSVSKEGRREGVRERGHSIVIVGLPLPDSEELDSPVTKDVHVTPINSDRVNVHVCAQSRLANRHGLLLFALTCQVGCGAACRLCCRLVTLFRQVSVSRRALLSARTLGL